VWTFTLRSGITFHDGTPLDAAAAVRNLQETGTGLLISNAIKDYGKNPDGSLAIEATGDLSFTIKTGKGGDLSQPLPWPNLPATLAGQLGERLRDRLVRAAGVQPGAGSGCGGADRAGGHRGTASPGLKAELRELGAVKARVGPA
jgi:hypothetical protein